MAFAFAIFLPPEARLWAKDNFFFHSLKVNRPMKPAMPFKPICYKPEHDQCKAPKLFTLWQITINQGYKAQKNGLLLIAITRFLFFHLINTSKVLIQIIYSSDCGALRER
ncbi:MAG: hypothetical protein BGO31_18270 [Bacteroidetes bacterium 43-16]|nr:MAG: hypothetical protein BGO31_18270 [Bacteroidetes bacterium 43-16]